MIEKVVGRVRYVVGSRHEESSGCPKRDNGIHRTKRKCEDSSGVIARERDDCTIGGEIVAGSEIGGYRSHTSTSILTNLSEFGFQGCETVGAGCEGQEGLAPASGLDVPEIHAAHITDVEWSDFS